MNFTLNDRAINFELEDRTDFTLTQGAVNFKLNAVTDVVDCLRLLEDGFERLLEDGYFRLLDNCGSSVIVQGFDYTLDFTFD